MQGKLCGKTITDIQEFEHESWGDRICFTFETDKLGKEGQPLSVFHETSPSLAPQAKLRAVIENVLNREITPQEYKDGFDVETLMGLHCQVFVKMRVSKAGKEYSIVESIIPSNGNEKPQDVKAASNVPATEEEDDIPF